MSRKTLLTEAEVRQFLKLANIGPVGDAKLTEMYGIEEELPPEEEEEAPMDDMGDAEMDMGDAEMDMDAAEDDMGDAEMDMGAEPGGSQMVSVDDFLSALEGALEDVLGDEVTVDSDEEEADLEGGEEEMDDMAMDMDMAGDEEEEELPGMRDGMYEGTEEDVVNEVARRVAARLQAKEDKASMIDQLAEKIMKRMTSKQLTNLLQDDIITTLSSGYFFGGYCGPLVVIPFSVYVWVYNL